MIDFVELINKRVSSILFDELIDRKIDLLFIDCAKNDYLDAFEISIPYLKKNSVVVADNIISKQARLKEFTNRVNLLEEKEKIESKIIPSGAGLLLIKILTRDL